MTDERLASGICMSAETNMNDPMESNSERSRTVRVKISGTSFKMPCWPQTMRRNRLDTTPISQMTCPRGRVVPISLMQVSPATKQAVVMTM